MRSSRAHFKYALKFAKRIKDTAKADAVAKDLGGQKHDDFWKSVSKMNQNSQLHATTIDGINSLSARILHRAPPRLQVDQNFLTQKIVADQKMQCHQNSFGIWGVTEAILGQKTCFFFKNIFWKKFMINHTIF